MSQSLIGAWKLLSFESRIINGTVIYLWGKDPKGYFIFSEDGFASVSIMSANRTNYSSEDMLQGSMEEKVAAADTYLSYAGPYKVVDDTIIVRSEISFFPNWVGKDQIRFFKFENDGNKLVLTTPSVKIRGADVVSSLAWERVREV